MKITDLLIEETIYVKEDLDILNFINICSKYNRTLMPVLNKNHKYLGTISFYRILNHLIPQYFSYFPTKDFFQNIPIIGKQLDKNKDITISGFVNKTSRHLQLETIETELLERIFKHDECKIFVTKNNKLIGYIDSENFKKNILLKYIKEEINE